jgi:CDP-diglyceride synthetase
MPGPFQPLLKPKEGEEDTAAVTATLGVGGLRADMMESFVTETQTKSIVSQVFITISLMILAAIIMWLFYWSYAKEKLLFMAILSGLMFIYTVIVIGVTVSYRAKLSTPTFTFLMGASAFMAFMTMISVIFFSVRASQRLKGADSYSGNTSYVPPAVQQYVTETDQGM